MIGPAPPGDGARREGDDRRPWWLVGDGQGRAVFVRASTRRRAAASYRYALYDSFVVQGLPRSVARTKASGLLPSVWEGPLTDVRMREIDREEGRIDRSWSRAEATLSRLVDDGRTTP